MIAIKRLSLSPTQVLVIGYLIIILLGTLLLSLPIATVPGRQTNLLDALFTATSATAVTGLIVVETATHWTLFGKIVIMLLIQVGGFGFMTTSTLIMLLLGKKITLKERLIIQEDLNLKNLEGVLRLVKYVVLVTLGIEFLGALLLFFSFVSSMGVGRAAFFGVFHAISAFNNAGFDIFGTSLETFTSNWYVISVISGLFIIGGIGFTVIAEVYSTRRFGQFSLHTKVVLSFTLMLIILGTGVIFLLEYNNPETLGELSWSGKLAAAYFQGVTPRTAGFNSVPIGKLTKASLFFLTVLMFIGASPGSTGGGIKTTTYGVLFAVFWTLMRNRSDVGIYQRRIALMTIFKAVSVVLISLLVIIVVTMVLSITEDFSFLAVYFETVSAFGTVGLSMGITGQLSELGRLLIISTMFVGRVGPMTLAVAIGAKRQQINLRYPEEEMMIG